MDAAVVVQATILIRAAIDGGKAVVALLRRRKARLPDPIPVYRLVTRIELLRARADRAIDITPRRQSL